MLFAIYTSRKERRPGSGGANRLSAETIRERVLSTHKENELYSFPNLEYEISDSASEVTLLCKKHGPMRMKVKSILTHRSGCNECGVRKPRKYDNRIFEERARAIHGEKYDYSQVVYERSQDKVTIVCPEHGPWKVTPHNHLLRKTGCPRCGAREGVRNSKPSKNRNLKSSKTVTIDGIDFHTDSGAERQVLPKLCAEYGTKLVLDQDHVLLITYSFRAENRIYRPDFYIPTENTLVEVKSPSTMGITAFCPDRRLTPTGTFEQVRCKALAAIRDGFKFRLFIVSRGKNPIELPETWIQLFDEPDKLKTFLVNFT
jgi:uncharacterized protein (DUF1499 family)